eukprot:m.80642 g.80642  ORF g.80642 m.80642 type:complete len:93 (-) comp10919_c0_seq1:1768-2046(-)
MFGMAVVLAGLATTRELPPNGDLVRNLFGRNGTITYILYAENFAGADWGQRINAAITEAINFGNGSAEIVLPSGDLNSLFMLYYFSSCKTAQ